MKKILVSTDGSENAKRALEEAKMIAGCTGADVDILNVVKNISTSPYMLVNDESMKTMDDLEGFGKKILDDAEKIFEDFPGEVNLKLISGNPADIIIKEGNEGKYDLIVMGNRGLGTFSRTMTGSVSSKVLNHSNIDVMIIK